MKRREFIMLLGGAAVAWPIAAQAQQAGRRIPRICQLQSSRSENAVALIEGLREVGYVDGQNVTIESRFYGRTPERLSEFVKELVEFPCDLIVAAAPYAIQALTKATSTIPIVGLDLESDPVASGWARSLSHPGKNVTGYFLDLPELAGKQIELLREAVPALSRLGVLWDSSIGAVQYQAAETAARLAAVTVESLPIQKLADFNDAFERAARERVHGIVVLTSPFIFEQRLLIADLAIRFRLPTISLFNLYPQFGGLMAYGPILSDMFRRAAIYVDRILKGAKAGELPIERPTRFALIINLKTAKALGLEVPPTLLARADEVIE
jgi:putative tryptophan/tyrosine transport system substrate-binding protein